MNEEGRGQLRWSGGASLLLSRLLEGLVWFRSVDGPLLLGSLLLSESRHSRGERGRKQEEEEREISELSWRVWGFRFFRSDRSVSLSVGKGLGF